MLFNFSWREREVLAPLLEIARGKFGYDRRAWLDELRVEAPTVAARLEALLAQDDNPSVTPIERPSVVTARVDAARAALSDHAPRRSSVA